MGGMEVDEPDATDRRLEEARKQLDESHAALMQLIRDALAEGRRPARIARHVGWSREYIADIRDGKAGKGLRRRQPAGARPVRHTAPA